MRPMLCRECFVIMEGSAWPLCDKCTAARVTEAVETPLDIPVLWDDDVPVLPKYDEQGDINTMPSSPPLAGIAPNKPPTMEERAAWFHANHVTVAEQVSRSLRPSFLQSLWFRVCRLASEVEMLLLRVL